MAQESKAARKAHPKHFVKGLPFKAHKITGFSPEMLEHHYEEVYGGAVRRLNEIEAGLACDGASTELRNEFVSVSNAIVLHEVYFASLGEDGGEALTDDGLQRAIEESFGTVDQWQAEFRALANSVPDGWVVLVWSSRFRRLMNVVFENDAQAVLDAEPLLAIDLAEHAYAADFGNDRAAYIEAFTQSLHWSWIAAQFHGAADTSPKAQDDDATQMSVADLTEWLDRGEDILVLDVRHDDDRERYTSRIMKTEWRDSFDVVGWAAEMPKDRPVVVYCMYGFWVSQKAAAELREHGVDARSLAGGITSWRAMGLPCTRIESQA
mgnify:CR=1 FL=1